MSCSPYDLRDYLFDELTVPQLGQMRAHLKTCPPCATELESLRSTQAALLTVRDEEIPQRIGFVSDKVFEPSPVRRWFAGFWTSAAQLGFVSSALLSGAILVHTLRPAEIVHNPAQPPAVTQAEIDRRIQDAVAAQVNAQLQTKIEAAVTQAVSQTEERAQKRTNALLAAAEKRVSQDRWSLTAQLEDSRYKTLKNNGDLIRANFGSTAQ